jgi:hypothetical protein
MLFTATFLLSLFSSLINKTNAEVRNIFSAKSAELMTDIWLEYGQVYADDSTWASVSTTSASFKRPQVFLSLANFGGSSPLNGGGAALALRIANISNSSGYTTFKVKVQHTFVYYLIVIIQLFHVDISAT